MKVGRDYGWGGLFSRNTQSFDPVKVQKIIRHELIEQRHHQVYQYFFILILSLDIRIIMLNVYSNSLLFIQRKIHSHWFSLLF